MKKVLILCFTNLKNDARVRRQINFLKDSTNVTVVCFDAFEDSQIEILRITPTKLTLLRKAILSVFLLLRAHKIAFHLLHNYSNALAPLKSRSFDLIVANDIETLPYAFDLKVPAAKVVFDAHEYAPRQFEDRLYWRVFFQKFITSLCYKYIPRIDGITTINDGLANAYRENFGVNPTIITNASDYFDLRPIPATEYPIKLVHHGIFTVSRRPELMIEMMEMLDDKFSLDLIYLVSENASPQTREYFNHFTEKATKTGKIRVLPPIKSADIVDTIHLRYDMGIILVPPVNFNYENGLPNKLFDCIQARMGMAVGPLKEIAHVVNTHRLGVVSTDFTATALADALRDLNLATISEFKNNAHVAAAKMNAQINKQIFLDMLARL